jgi:hypothetical protein
VDDNDAGTEQQERTLTDKAQTRSAVKIPSSTVRLARALVHDAKRRGTRESSRVEAVASTPLPEGQGR